VRFVDAPNGRKKELETVEYIGSNSKRLLFMTHLTGDRQHESYWFIKDIWPRIVKKVVDAELWLVGTPPNNESSFLELQNDNIKICGYCDDISSVFKLIAITVLPSHHGTGWINRIADSLTAGVPIVACSQPLRTIPGLEIGIHALKADSTNEFVSNITRLLINDKLRKDMSKKAKRLGATLPTWNSTLQKLDHEVNN